MSVTPGRNRSKYESTCGDTDVLSVISATIGSIMTKRTKMRAVGAIFEHNGGTFSRSSRVARSIDAHVHVISPYVDGKGDRTQILV